MQQLINERILVLDGAMGTMIQQYNLSEVLAYEENDSLCFKFK